MSHLAIETLARLVDETPTAGESAHLAQCTACSRELEAMRDDVRALGTLPDLTPAPDAWAALEQRLAQEGLVRTTRRGFVFPTRTVLQAAAALTLFLGGSVLGRVTAAPEQVIVRGPDERAPTLQQPAANAQLAAETAAPEPRNAGNPNVTLAASGGSGRTLPRTMEEAATQLRQTEELYLSALTRYAELATQAESGDPIARLAALQSIVMTTQAALHQTPTDPVINGYHLTALAQRDATLRQVAAATNDRWY